MEGLEALLKLDVLDLHCNQIKALEGLSHLAELRVLNLAGNQIASLDTPKLLGMHALIELNLRRNLISGIEGLQALPALQRLFLSNNAIATFGALGSLMHMGSLHELALDGCRVASKLMRERMIEHAKHLWAMRQVTLRVADDETGDETKPIPMETE